MSILADFLSDSEDYHDGDNKELELVSLESDYLELSDISVEMYQYQSAIEQIDSINHGVCNLYESMEKLKNETNVQVDDVILINKAVNSLIEPIDLRIEMPSFESNELYITSYKINIGLEGIRDILRTIKEFILKLYDGFINAMKKFFNWVKGLFGKTKSNAEKSEKKIEKKILLLTHQPSEKIEFKGITIDFGDTIKQGRESDIKYIEKIIGNTFDLVDGLLNSVMLWDTNSGKHVADGLILLNKINYETATAGEVKDKINEFLKLTNDAYVEHANSIKSKPTRVKTKNNLTMVYFDEILGNGAIVCTSPSVFNVIVDENWKEAANNMVTNNFNPSGWKWIKGDSQVKSKPTTIADKDVLPFLTTMKDLCRKAKGLDITAFTKVTNDTLEQAKKDFDKQMSECEKNAEEGQSSNITDAIRFISNTAYKFVTNGANSSNQIVKGYLPALNSMFRVIDQATK